MKPKQSSPHEDELGIMDFTATVKPKEKGVTPNISLEQKDVKEGLESAMTIIFQSLAEIHRLQRKGKEGSDG